MKILILFSLLISGCSFFDPQTNVGEETTVVKALTDEYSSNSSQDQLMASGSLMIEAAGVELRNLGISSA